MQAELVEKTDSLGDALAKIRQLYDAIETDLDEARRLQTSFLNDTHRRFAAAEVSLWLKASGHVGGDMVGFFRRIAADIRLLLDGRIRPRGRAGMLVARVAGMLKDGAPELNIGLSSLGRGLFAPVPPDMVAAQLNAQILNEVKGERYLTLCLGFLDQRSGVVRMVQAGHPSPLLLRAKGGIERLGSGGMPLGLFDDARYHQFEFRLCPGDRLLLYSDGLTECPVAEGIFLDEDGLMALCRKHANARGQEMIAHIATDLEQMVGGADFPDDASALLVEYDGPAG
jgi:sigma-B regulation protein RsbU (phosphoserine phosphatase)